MCHLKTCGNLTCTTDEQIYSDIDCCMVCRDQYTGYKTHKKNRSLNIPEIHFIHYTLYMAYAFIVVLVLFLDIDNTVPHHRIDPDLSSASNGEDEDDSLERRLGVLLKGILVEF